MPSQPLTPSGVAAKITEIYALSDSALAVQADSVESDFRGWVRTNFSLTTAQDSFLTAIDNHAVKYYGAQCSLAFRSRLSVSLVVNSDPGSTTKWVKSESTLSVSSNASGAVRASGTLTFTFYYQNV